MQMFPRQFAPRMRINPLTSPTRLSYRSNARTVYCANRGLALEKSAAVTEGNRGAMTSVLPVTDREDAAAGPTVSVGCVVRGVDAPSATCVAVNVVTAAVVGAV